MPPCCTTPQARKPLILFSTEGGMDIEEIAAEKPDAIRRLLVDIDGTPRARDIAAMLKGLDLGAAQAQIAEILDRLHAAYRARDAELLEINPLALLADGRVVALDCKFVLDDASVYRQPEIAGARLARRHDRTGKPRAPRPGSSSSSSTAMSACWRTAPG